MALLEIHFPNGFWDITPHLVLHLPRELYWCGPVQSRWMYSVEQYLGVLKSFVRNKNRPEGNIAMGYMYEEALGFVTEHFRLYPITARAIWDVEEDECDSGEKMEGIPHEVEWHEEDLIEVHEHVIKHSTVTEPYLGKRETAAVSSCYTSVYWAYKVEKRRFEARRHRRFQSFGTWIKEKVQKMVDDGEAPSLDLVNLSKLPSAVVREYRSMWAYGNHYRVDDEVGESHISNDSGVAAMITQVCRSSRADRHPVEALLKYVGIVKGIYQFDYGYIKFNVMRCSWIRPDLQETPTISQDEHGFWSVNFDARQILECEPFILPSHADQVYFVDDLRNPHWRVVVHKDPRSRRVTNITRDESLSAPGPVDATRRFPAEPIPEEEEIVPEGEAVLGVDVEHVFAHQECDDDDAAHEDVDYEDEEEQENDHPNAIPEDLHPRVVVAGLDDV